MNLRANLKKVKLPPVRGLWRNLAIFFAVLGPGMITANVDNDAGGIATYSIAGAHYGYAFVWTVIPIIVLLMIVQEMSARMGAVTGKGFSDLIRENFGVRVTFYIMLALLITNIANTMAEFSGVAESLHIFGVSKYVSVPMAAFFVWLLVVKGNYRVVEKVFLIACLFYVAYPISGFLAKPDWTEVSSAMVHPKVWWGQDFFYLLVGLIGTTIAPWMQFYMQASIVEKGVDVANYRQSRWDVFAGCVMAGLVVFFIILACAATLYPAGVHIESAGDAAMALAPLAGKYASWLFAFGLFNASLFAASVLPLSTAYYICEGLGFEAGMNKSFREAPYFYGLYTAIIAIGAAVILIPGFPLLRVMVFSQVLNGILLPFVLILMLVLINRKDVMGEFTNRLKGNVAAWIAVLVLLGLTTFMLMSSFKSWQGPVFSAVHRVE
ncbi:MAG: Nramp family divalent metal transporter [Deltaproteobacteria bacterium]|nr:Nramp family divalent metal transporter [Deltaproteobacteria bacterium]